MKKLTYGELNEGLERGECFRLNHWPESNYIFKNENGKHRHHGHYTETFPIALYDPEDECAFVKCEGAVIDNADKIEKVIKYLKGGARAYKEDWMFAYLHYENGQVMLYWEQENGNVYDEPYNFGPLEDVEYIVYWS